MRALIGLAVFSAVSLLQGCTLVGAGVSADLSRQRRAEATTSGPDMALRPPAPGDTLTLRLADGGTARGAFISVSPDSLALDTGTFALGDVDRVVRPWVRPKAGAALALGALVDFAVIWLAFQDLSIDFGGLNL